jgi:2-dehydropantoate 2-reductase
MEIDSILILGTGALATLFAARLAVKGVRVTMLGTWPEGLVALNTRGIRVDGDDRVVHVHATDNPAECIGFRFALVLVKSWQTERAARQLSICLADDGLAMTLQNGLGNNTILARYLGLARVAQGVTTMGATLVAPAFVRPGGDGPVAFEFHPQLHPLEEMFKRSGFELSVVDNLNSLIWGKLVVSSAINPLTSLLRVKNGELLENPFAHMLMEELTCETSEVATRLGVVLPYTDSKHAVEEVAERTAENLSSMLQDILRGAPTEIDAINGAIVHLARESRVQVPVNRTICSLMKAIIVHGKIENYKI